MKIEDTWDIPVKEMWAKNKQDVREGLSKEFGIHNLQQKEENFIDIGTKPMSVLAYHNNFFAQARNAYVIGSYYPALVSACALGERILNHLIIDLRQFFTATPEFRRIYNKSSFDNWDVPINTLESWSMLLPEAVEEFRQLKHLRHRSIHFNPSTYATLKKDALAAILHMRTIIDLQFGTFGLRPWFIEGTKGHMFVRKDYEDHPFVKTYFVPRCPFVGPLFGLGPGEGGWEVFDVPDYGDGIWTDAEFAQSYNDRDPEQVLTEMPTIQRSY